MMPELEWKIRKERIDKKLKALSPAWSIVKYHKGLDSSLLQRHAVEEYPTANGPADYALFVKGKFLGIIEAKKVGVGPQNVLEQAKRYSRGAFDGSGNWNGYRISFLYSTNGETVYFIDVRYKKAKGYVDKPTQSMLAKAFRGELVPQDPNDEPASVLLEHIREERGKRADKSQTGKTKNQRRQRRQNQLEMDI